MAHCARTSLSLGPCIGNSNIVPSVVLRPKVRFFAKISQYHFTVTTLLEFQNILRKTFYAKHLLANHARNLPLGIIQHEFSCFIKMIILSPILAISARVTKAAYYDRLALIKRIALSLIIMNSFQLPCNLRSSQSWLVFLARPRSGNTTSHMTTRCHCGRSSDVRKTWTRNRPISSTSGPHGSLPNSARTSSLNIRTNL